jgi:hypothetical protein
MSEKQKGQTRATEGKGGNSKLLIVVGVVVIILLVVIIAILIPKGNSDSESEQEPVVEEDGRREVLVTEENAERIAEELLTRDPDEENEIPVQYTVTMTSQWHFKNGESASDNAYVANNKANSTDVYFDVVRNDTKEVIYASPVLPVGSEIRGIKLDSDLEPGEYDCTLIYYLVDGEQKVLTTVNMWVGITIDE